MKSSGALLLLSLLSLYPADPQTKTDVEIDGLHGRVKVVQVEIARSIRAVGRPVQEERFLESVTTYNEQGYRIEKMRYRSDGALFERQVFSHDEKGNQTTKIYKADGTLDSTWVYNFDEHGWIKGSAWYNPDGTLHIRIARTHDANGKLIEEAWHDADGSLRYKIVYSFDADGNQVESAGYDGNGALSSRTAYSKTGARTDIYAPNGKSRYKDVRPTPSLEYDSQGNWIKWSSHKTVMQDRERMEIDEVSYRTIVYF